MPPEKQHPLPTHHPVPSNLAQHVQTVYSLGNPSIPKLSLPWHPPGFWWQVQDTWMLAVGKATLAMGTRVKRKSRERQGLLPGMTVDGNGLQDRHLVFRPPSLGHPNLQFRSVFEMHHIHTFFCALRQPCNVCFFFPHLNFRGFVRDLTISCVFNKQI